MSVRICIIGAGFAGIAAGVGLQAKAFDDVEFVIYEENSDVGGVWMSNRYPGAAAELASPIYSYSFAPSTGTIGLMFTIPPPAMVPMWGKGVAFVPPSIWDLEHCCLSAIYIFTEWSRLHAPRGEIHAYLQKVASDHKLIQFTRFNHQVKRAIWDQGRHGWVLTVLNKNTQVVAEEFFDIVIACTGTLRTPQVPDEFSNFQGPLLHSAQWEEGVQLEGKRVAVVGNGSTAAQIIPAILGRVRTLINYQRSPSYVFPTPEFLYPGWLLALIRAFPRIWHWVVRTGGFLLFEVIFPCLPNAALGTIGETISWVYLWSEMRKEPRMMLAKLTPNTKFGCKPPTSSTKFYSAMRNPKVELVRSRIVGVTQDSIRTQDGEEREIDVLILATGFKVQEYFAPLELVGKDGVELLAEWKKSPPSTHKSMVTSLAPNWFMVAGPNSLSVAFLPTVMEFQVDYILQVIAEMRKRRARSVSVKESVEKTYMAQLRADLGRFFWGAGCSSITWFLEPEGRTNTSFSPYPLVSRWWETRWLDPADFDFD